MWLFTPYGFYSAVCARQGDGGYGQPVDSDRIMVRARLKQHLESLRDRFPEQLGDCEVLASKGTDYAFRIFVSKDRWSQVLVGLSDELSYDNFKDAVARRQGKAGDRYVNALHEVWEVMHRLQR